MNDDEMLKQFVEIANKDFILNGNNPSSPDFKTIKCSLIEWQITITIIQNILMHLGKTAAANEYMNLMNPRFQTTTDSLSHNANIFLQKEEFLHTQIEAATRDLSAILAKVGKSIDQHLTREKVKKNFIFLANNPGGIEGQSVPAENNEVEVKGKDSELKYEITLLGIEPKKPKGEKIILERSYWLCGFSSVCTHISSITRNEGQRKQYIDLALKTLLGEPIKIDADEHGLLYSSLNALLKGYKGDFWIMVLKGMNNPQISQYYRPDKEVKLDKKAFFNSMKELRAFMKVNNGFKTV